MAGRHHRDRVRPGKTGRELTSFTDLWDPAFAGHVGMLTEMVDTMNLTLMSLGVDIQNATDDDVQRAKEKLIEQRDAGIVRQYYGQDYTRALAEGDVWATMAWSGDVLQLQLANPDLRFVVPEEGGILWVTPMELLRTARASRRRARVPRLRLPAGDRDGHHGVGRIRDTRARCAGPRPPAR